MRAGAALRRCAGSGCGGPAHGDDVAEDIVVFEDRDVADAEEGVAHGGRPRVEVQCGEDGVRRCLRGG